MCGAAIEDRLKILEADFLKEQADCRTARQKPGFSVVNLQAMDFPAPGARIFPELASRDLLASGWCWRFLTGFRVGIGKMFGWGPDLAVLKPQPLGAEKYCGFSRVIHVDAPRIVGMTVEKRLPRALIP